MACFSTLPDDCVQLVFNRIPTEHLFKVGHVSRVWRRHQLLNCRGRKTLILLQGQRRFGSNAQSVIEESTFNKPFMSHHIDQNGNYMDYKSFFVYNRIYISTDKPLKVKVLVETFPNLEKLIISTGRTYLAYLRSFIKLISSYPSKLVSLQLYFGNQISGTQTKSVGKTIDNLISQLNSLSVLQSFTFYSSWSLNAPIEAPEFITRLKEFYLDCGGLEEVMLDWVRKYYQAGRLNQLTRICLTNNLLFRMDGNLPTKFDHIPATNCFAFIPISINYNLEKIDEAYMKRIVANFTSLSTFKYTMDKINSLTKLSTILSPLPKLVHIDLTIASATPIDPIFTAQQKSIKALDLDFPGRYYNCSVYENFLQSQINSIVHVFPNLQSIRITPDELYVCWYYNEDYINEIHHKVVQLAEQFFDNLKVAYGKPTLRTKYC